jgi:hypothetical protein
MISLHYHIKKITINVHERHDVFSLKKLDSDFLKVRKTY